MTHCGSSVDFNYGLELLYPGILIGQQLLLLLAGQ
jgi:hypothetical protein